MSATPSVPDPRLRTVTAPGWWHARRVRSARGGELALSPMAAVRVAQALDELEVPGVLPNATLLGAGGREARLWDLARGSRTLVTFYAPWCGPCGLELPKLVAGTQSRGNLVVVLGRDEDPEEAHRQVANLGLRELSLWTDHTGELERRARVTRLPTTYLIGRHGKVRNRVVGFSQVRLDVLLARAGRDDD
jgi:thiol-disulfide isomerase/thioredoxin